MPHPVGERDRPLHGLHPAETAADDCGPLRDAEPVGQPRLAAHPVLNGDDGEIRAVGLAVLQVDGGRAGGAFAAAQVVATHYEELAGINRLAGADAVIPPAGFAGIVLVVVAGDVMIARQRVADQHGVAAVGVQRAVGFVNQFIVRQRPTAVQRQRFIKTGGLGRDQTDGIGGKSRRHEFLTVVVMSLEHGLKPGVKSSASTRLN